MLEPAQIITLKPVNKLLSASGKTHITAKEYREMLAGLVKNPRSAPCYDKILAPLESELFLGRRRISKLELQQQLDARLRAAELNFRRVLHKPLYSENAYCAPGDVTQYYDLAYYNPAAPLVSGHAHNNQSQYSTFYMRFEDAPDHDNLLVGNLQTARLEKTSHPLWQRPNLKKLMVQMAIQEAQRTRRKYLTFHSGAALVIAQNWKKPPSKQAYYEKTVRQNPHAELITPDNIDYYRALHCRKIELLAQAPKPLKKEFYIARKEYEIIKKTSVGLQIKPAGLFAYTADPLGYLFELGAQQEHARNLAQTLPEITLSPGFENLPDLTSTCPWGEKIYTQLWDSYCNKNYHQFTDYFNEIIKKLLPGSAGVPAACSIKQLGALMDNFAEIGAVSGALMVHYLRHFNYLHLLMNKYCFLQEKFTGRPGQAALY